LLLLPIVPQSALISNFEPFAVNASSTTINASSTNSLGNLLQYEWPQFTGDSSYTRFSAGPAPEAPDVLWKTNITGIQSYISAFNSMVFVTTLSAVYALDKETGSVIWNTNVPAPGPWPEVYKIDDSHMVVGSSCLDTQTGRILWNSNNFSANTEPLFSANVYSPEEQMFYTTANSFVQAWNFTDPSHPPTQVWTTFVPGGGQYGSGITYGDGKVFPGSFQSHQIALDAKNGRVLWDTETKGAMLFSGSYYQGKFIRAGSHDNTMYCFNASDGKILWTFNPKTEDGYFTVGPAVAYGMVYELNKDGNLYALNVETGKEVWKYQGPGALMFPGNPTIAEGKIYATTGQKAAFSGQTGKSEFACLDAFSGGLIWKLPIEAFAPRESVAIAYGNLYMIPGDVTTSVDSLTGGEYSKINQIWAIGTRDWPMWRHDAAHSGVGQSGPTNFTLRWSFATGGAVVSSPTVADGRAYFGSQDKNIYAVDARTGSFIWRFTTLDRIESSPAVANGKVFTGADDGNVYCLDAFNGSLIWVTSAGGNLFAVFNAAVILRSSPIVVGDKLYVGALDNKTYALNVNNGSISWTFQTKGYITSSPAVANGAVYITSQEPSSGALYKLDANTGSLIWKRTIPYESTLGGGTDMHASPTVADGMVFVSANTKAYYAIDATTGNIKWTFRDDEAGQFLLCSTIYKNGKLFLIDHFSIACLEANSGRTIWSSYIGEELYVSPSYADDKLYVVTDQRSIYVLNATNGTKLGNFSTSSNSWSSPTIYEGRVYVGNNDWNVYCLASFPPLNSSITIELGTQAVLAGELVSGGGFLLPKIKNTTIVVVFVQPDGTQVNKPILTSDEGDFAFTFTPEMVGNWMVATQWPSDRSYYASSTSEFVSLLVESSPTPTPAISPTPTPIPTPPPTPSPTPTPFLEQKVAGIPLPYIYIAVIIGLVTVIGAAGFVLRRKTPK
jgi:outer membrane protein assembly factor BamB